MNLDTREIALLTRGQLVEIVQNVAEITARKILAEQPASGARWLTAKQAAEALGVCHTTFSKMVKEAGLPGGRGNRYTREQIDALIEKRKRRT